MLEYLDPLREALKLADLGLTPREIEVLRWVVEGKATSAIATIIGSSVRTVHKHLERIYRKLNVENRTAAAAAVHALRRQAR
jgi:DNA-binding CsgD family transcriptional regulator